MTGTGTSADPFIPDNWDELITACGTSGAVISLPEGGEWDMNEQYPDGVPTVSMNKSTINGNGFRIKNLRIKDNDAFSSSAATSIINNLDIQDLYHAPTSSKYLFDAGTYAMTLNRVRVSGMVVGAYLIDTGSGGGSVRAYACSFNIQLVNGNFVNSNYDPYITYYNGTNIKLTGTTNYSKLGVGALYDESQIEGSVLSTRGNTVFVTSYNRLAKINIGLSGFSEVKTNTTYNTVINTDIIDATTISSQLIQATAEQMKDADWLTEHGFPCGKES